MRYKKRDEALALSTKIHNAEANGYSITKQEDKL